MFLLNKSVVLMNKTFKTFKTKRKSFIGFTSDLFYSFKNNV